MEIMIGNTYETPYFFCKDKKQDGTEYWYPGIGVEDDDYKSNYYAHGIGTILFTVLDIYRPPKPYKPRVFFTSRLTDPDGNLLKQNRLLCLTIPAFKGRLIPYDKRHGMTVEIEEY